MRSSSSLALLARWCATHRALTVFGWLLITAAVTLAAASYPAREISSVRLPGTESQRVHDLLSEHFPGQNAASDQMVFHARRGTLRTPAARAGIARALARIREQPGVAHVSDPLAAGGRLSPDGRTGLAEVSYRGGAVDEGDVAALREIQGAAFSVRSNALQVEHGGLGGQIVRRSESGSSELIGLAAAAVVLLLTFGSLMAAGMPLLTAVFALAATLGGITLLSHVVDTPDFAAQLASLIGIGVGIDYALFVVTRYRSEVADGHERLDAIMIAADTAGRTVLLAGSTVIVALLGLLLLGLNFLEGVAVGAALAVATTVAGALTLLPALLAIVGKRIEPRRRRRARAAGRPIAPEGVLWVRWSRAVQRRPWAAAALGLLILLALAAPALDLRLGTSDASVDPPASTSHRAYALTSSGFGAGANGSFLLAAPTPKGGDGRGVARVLDAVRQTPGIAAVGPPRQSPDGAVTTFTAAPTTGPQDPATTATLERLREQTLPRLEQSTGIRSGVGGITASDQDFTRVVADKLPLFVAIVVLLSAGLLLVVFRSVVIPVKAAAMNLLSIGAALGVVTAIFQDGVGAELLGVGTGPIEWFLPVLLFSIVFGLSMDYEIFLLSRVREEWQATGDASAAVARGLAGTGRVITAAASIMIVVFASFALSDDRLVKLFGIGLASAILIDAVVIRCLLVPALMELFGRRAWWMPKSLERLVPRMAGGH